MRPLRLAVAAALVVVAAAAAIVLAVHRTPHNQPALANSNTPPSSAGQGQDVTVLLDFSASFAPYGQGDQLVLRWVSGALEELATKWWTPPVTIVWRRIGTSSLLPRPICDPVEFSPKLTDGGKSLEKFKKDVLDCLSTANRQSANKGEAYTDISSAIAGAVKSRESSPANKTLVVFSDFKEDPAPATHPATFQLNGETVVMLHRPGTDEANMAEYLNRIRQWKALLQQRGAGRIVSFSQGLVTHSNLVQYMQTGTKPSGTAATILVDLKDQFNLGKTDDAGDVKYIHALAHSVAGMAREWPAPVTVRLGAIPNTALRMRWMPPVVFQPTLVQAPLANGPEGAPVKTVADLQLGMDEGVRGLRRLSMGPPTTDVVGAVSLAQSGSELENQESYLFIVSDFVDSVGLPASLQSSLRGSHVVMVYRPASRDGADAQGFLARIEAWKQVFQRAGAQSVCQTEMATLTERSIRRCLGMD